MNQEEMLKLTGDQEPKLVIRLVVEDMGLASMCILYNTYGNEGGVAIIELVGS